MIALICSAFAAQAAPSPVPEAAAPVQTLIGHIAKQSDVDQRNRRIYVTTENFGDFWIKLPEGRSLLDLLFTKDLRVTLETPREQPFAPGGQEEVPTAQVDSLSRLTGQVLAVGEGYADVRLVLDDCDL